MSCADLFLDEFGTADFIIRAVDVEAGRGKIFKRDCACCRADFESDFLIFLAVSSRECAGDLKHIVIIEAINNIFAVTACIIESILAAVAPKAVISLAAGQSVVTFAA